MRCIGREVHMMTLVHEQKDARMDLRMTRQQKALFEKAASIRGETLTRWSMANLVDAAEREIREAETIWLSSEDFDRFAEAVEKGGMPDKVKQLLAREPRWA